MSNKCFFVFDVESVGLFGEGFAVGGGLYEHGSALWEFQFACDPDDCAGEQADRNWVRNNVPIFKKTHKYPKQLRTSFWNKMLEAKKVGALIVAECSWPVEARFLLDCIKDDSSRSTEGPYPLIDVSSILLSVGLNPLAIFERKPDELPKHDPLADARQSARLLFDYLKF